jgi:hypothetical protein
MPISRRAFLQLAALGAASLAGNIRPGSFNLGSWVAKPALHLLTTGRPLLSSTVDAFTHATGHLVQLSEAQSANLTGFDLAIVSANHLTQLIHAGKVLTLAATKTQAHQRPYDPFNTFSLPAGRGAIGINARFATPPDTWASFFGLAATVPTHLPPVETFHAALKHFGGSLNTRKALAYSQARELVNSLNSAPLDSAQLALGPQIPGWHFTVPLIGAELWEDCYCIPVTSPHPELAQAFIDFVSQSQSLPALPPSPALEPRSSFAPSF